MIGKNNTQERFRRNATKDKRYTLKKLSVGLASVALGTVLFLNGAETVSAETEVSEPNETTDALSEVEQVTQPVQSTFQFSYVRNGGQIDGFTGDYANAHEAEKAFRHHANQHGYTLLNIRLEGNTFIADVQADNSTFQFNYLNEATGEKLDSFFGDYLNASEAEKDFRNYANEHGYTLSNVRLEGNTFTADVAVAEESQPAEATFQFIYRNKETGKKLDGFFSDYSNASEAEKDFRNYANQHGYTLSNIRKNGQTFTADVVRQEQSGTTDSDRYVEAAKQRARQLINALDNLTAEQKADYLAQVEAAESVAQVESVYDEAKNVVNEVEKDYSYTLNFGDRTESANLGEFDSEEQAELALRILTNEKGYKLSNLRLEGRTFIADAKVETEQDQSSEQTNRYLQEAKKRALEIINGLENLFDTQKPSYLERIENADSVAAVKAIVEEAQNYVNESKGGENGQAAEEPERPEYNPEQNLVTYDIQITDHNGKTQTQRVTFPSRELALNYISQLVRSYEKAGVVLNEERSDVEGRDNTFILVFEKKQAEQKPEEKPELDVPTPNENAPAPEKLDTAKAEALDAIAGLKYLSAKEKEELVELINEADNLTEVNYLVGAAYKLNINKFPGKVPAPEELDVAKAEALDAIAGLEYLSEEEKAGFVERINETVELGEVNRLVGLAFKRNIENFPEKTPEQDPEEEAGRELDAAKVGALEDIANLDYFTTTEKQDLVDRVNEYDNIGDIDFVVSKAIEENDRRHLEKEGQLQEEKDKLNKEIDEAVTEGVLDADQATGLKGYVVDAETTEAIEATREVLNRTIFENQKAASIHGVGNDKGLSENLQNKYISLLEKAGTGSELDKILTLLDAEVAVVKAEQEVEYAIDKLRSAEGDDVITVEEQTDIIQANKILMEAKKEAQGELSIVPEITDSGETSELGEELKSVKKDLLKRVEAVQDVRVPKVSPEEREAFKKVLMNYLKKETPNLSNLKAYDQIVDLMKEQDNVEEKTVEILQIARAEDIVEQVKKETDYKKKDRLKKRAKAILDTVEGSIEDGGGNSLPKYKQELLKQKQRVQELLNDGGNILSAENNSEYAIRIAKNKALEEINRHDLSEEIKEAYKDRINESNKQIEIDEVLKTLVTELAIRVAEESVETANKLLKEFQNTGEFTASDQGVVNVANEKIAINQSAAQVKLEELTRKINKNSDETPSELKKELQEYRNKLQDRLERVKQVEIPEISDKELKELKDDAKSDLKGLVPNLTDLEREIYENIIDQLKSKDNSEKKINEIVQVAMAEALLKQNKSTTNQAVIERNKRNAQTSLNFVDETLEEGQNYPEYKKELLKQKQRVQDLLNDQTENVTPKVTFESKLEEAKEISALLLSLLNENKSSDGKPVATEEYKKAYEKYVDKVSDLESLAKTEKQRSSVEGLKGLFGPLKIFK
ncbi:GA-like domain-containing protein [Dolosigranulum pigrum]|uniref:GA-like domain-containing protein n=1 Tax=Dolosigranulum pigrum TaxID=29394 RepID=UPI00191A047F|nr:YSIRK-type signal peptide-containing protein [Dolosigranulum pigrum]